MRLQDTWFLESDKHRGVPKPNEDVVSITFELGVALTCLLNLAGEEIRDRLYEQCAPVKEELFAQTKEELFDLLELSNPNVQTDKLNLAGNAEADQFWQMSAQGDQEIPLLTLLDQDFLTPSSIVSTSDSRGRPAMDALGGIISAKVLAIHKQHEKKRQAKFHL